MRAWRGVAIVALVATCALLCAADDDADAVDRAVRVERRSPVEWMRAALRERIAFDEVTVEFPAKEDVVLLRRAGAPLGEHDELVWELRDLDEALAREATLRSANDEELAAKLDAACPVPPHDAIYEIIERDAILVEVVRRGGAAWRERLAKHVAALARWTAEAASKQGTAAWAARDLELLTALRRLEGKPDPVRIEIAAPEPVTYPDLPVVELRIVNRDERRVMITRGGDYRSGREGRYHVEARDAKGRFLPSAAWPRFGEGGGLSCRESLAPGAELTTSLPLGRYIAPLDPGEHRVRVHYSDWSHIADADGHLGTITVVSEPLTIRVLPRVVGTTATVQARLAALAGELPKSGPVHVLGGTYGPWAHEFVGPDTPAGKLAAAGWEAVPALVRFAARADADPLRRAWAFAVLYGITGRLDPTRGGAIGDYEMHGGGPGAVTGGGFSASSHSMSSPDGGRPDAAAQARLAREWEKLVAIVELRFPK